jgi:hypothetical protein
MRKVNVLAAFTGLILAAVLATAQSEGPHQLTAKEQERIYQATKLTPAQAKQQKADAEARVKREKAEAKARAKREKQRLANEPSQPSISEECVMVYDIRSHGFGILANITFVPGLSAKVRNNCNRTASVFLKIGYFNSRGDQFGDGTVSATVAPGAVYTINHEIYQAMYHDLLKAARVLSVQAFPN